MSDENAPQGETPPADEPASEGPTVTLVPELQEPVADSQSARRTTSGRPILCRDVRAGTR